MTLIRIIDLETTGTEPTDAVVEIGAIDVVFNTHTKALADIRVRNSGLVNPKRPIPPQASAIHHIVDCDVRDALVWDEVCPEYFTPEVSFYAAHNAAFEAMFIGGLIGTTPLICTYKSALRIWPDAPGHSNQTLRYWRDLHCGLFEREFLDHSHRALADAVVTAYLLVNLIEAGVSFDDMVEWSKQPPLLPTCPIGEWRGKPWHEVEYGFLSWMINKPVDNPDYVWNAKREMSRRAGAQDYMKLMPDVIAMAKSVKDLNDWFLDEKNVQGRQQVGIVKGSEEYDKLAKLCAAHKAKLLTQQKAEAA